MTKAPIRIDCDFHLPQVSVADLVPLLDDYWQRQIEDRDIISMPFRLSSYPPNSPLSNDPEYDGQTVPEVLDRFGTTIAITSMLHGVVALHNPDMRAALLTAVNDHVTRQWLDTEPRLRGSIFVSAEDPEASVAEIERLAPDSRYVQVLMLAMQERHHGARHYWPIYEAAERHDLTIAIHAGGLYRNPPSVAGWPSYQFEDYVMQSAVFENILVALLGEGVMQKFPNLKFVFLESGFAWLPTAIWRMNKTWRGVRQEVPWLSEQPSEVMRDRVFFGLQPVDPPGPEQLQHLIKHIGSTDMLLYSTDYPHRQFLDNPVPTGFPEQDKPGLLFSNALRAYPRLASDPVLSRAVAEQEVAV
jgi:uncharacterized protein